MVLACLPIFYCSVELNITINLILRQNLGYPPSSIARQNRANKKGEPLFYCSSSKEAVFYELDLKSGDRLALSSWVVQKPILVNNLTYMVPNISRFGLLKGVNDEEIEKYKEKAQAVDLQIKCLHDFVIKTFCKKIEQNQEYEYRKTQAIARLYLQNPFQGLIYPTIKIDGTADNFAIKPFALDTDSIQLTSVEYIEISDCESNHYTYKILDYCDTMDNQDLLWYNFTNTWTTNSFSPEEIAFIKDGSEILAYNQYGDLVSPN